MAENPALQNFKALVVEQIERARSGNVRCTPDRRDPAVRQSWRRRDNCLFVCTSLTLETASFNLRRLAGCIRYASLTVSGQTQSKIEKSRADNSGVLPEWHTTLTHGTCYQFLAKKKSSPQEVLAIQRNGHTVGGSCHSKGSADDCREMAVAKLMSRKRKADMAASAVAIDLLPELSHKVFVCPPLPQNSPLSGQAENGIQRSQKHPQTFFQTSRNLIHSVPAQVQTGTDTNLLLHISPGVQMCVQSLLPKTDRHKENLTRNNNSLIGESPMSSHFTRNNNSLIGESPMSRHLTRNNNSLIGESPMSRHLTRNNNSLIGESLMSRHLTRNKSLIGESSMSRHLTRNNNSLIGESLMSRHLTHNNNSLIGGSPMSRHLTRNNNSLIGDGHTPVRYHGLRQRQPQELHASLDFRQDLNGDCVFEYKYRYKRLPLTKGSTCQDAISDNHNRSANGPDDRGVDRHISRRKLVSEGSPSPNCTNSNPRSFHGKRSSASHQEKCFDNDCLRKRGEALPKDIMRNLSRLTTAAAETDVHGMSDDDTYLVDNLQHLQKTTSKGEMAMAPQLSAEPGQSSYTSGKHSIHYRPPPLALRSSQNGTSELFSRGAPQTGSSACHVTGLVENKRVSLSETNRDDRQVVETRKLPKFQDLYATSSRKRIAHTTPTSGLSLASRRGHLPAPVHKYGLGGTVKKNPLPNDRQHSSSSLKKIVTGSHTSSPFKRGIQFHQTTSTSTPSRGSTSFCSNKRNTLQSMGASDTGRACGGNVKNQLQNDCWDSEKSQNASGSVERQSVPHSPTPSSVAEVKGQRSLTPPVPFSTNTERICSKDEGKSQAACDTKLAEPTAPADISGGLHSGSLRASDLHSSGGRRTADTATPAPASLGVKARATAVRLKPDPLDAGSMTRGSPAVNSSMDATSLASRGSFTRKSGMGQALKVGAKCSSPCNSTTSRSPTPIPPVARSPTYGVPPVTRSPTYGVPAVRSSPTFSNLVQSKSPLDASISPPHQSSTMSTSPTHQSSTMSTIRVRLDSPMSTSPTHRDSARSRSTAANSSAISGMPVACTPLVTRSPLYRSPIQSATSSAQRSNVRQSCVMEMLSTNRRTSPGPVISGLVRALTSSGRKPLAAGRQQTNQPRPPFMSTISQTTHISDFRERTASRGSETIQSLSPSGRQPHVSPGLMVGRQFPSSVVTSDQHFPNPPSSARKAGCSPVAATSQRTIICCSSGSFEQLVSSSFSSTSSQKSTNSFREPSDLASVRSSDLTSTTTECTCSMTVPVPAQQCKVASTRQEMALSAKKTPEKIEADGDSVDLASPAALMECIHPREVDIQGVIPPRCLPPGVEEPSTSEKFCCHRDTSEVPELGEASQAGDVSTTWFGHGSSSHVWPTHRRVIVVTAVVVVLAFVWAALALMPCSPRRELALGLAKIVDDLLAHLSLRHVAPPAL